MKMQGLAKGANIGSFNHVNQIYKAGGQSGQREVKPEIKVLPLDRLRGNEFVNEPADKHQDQGNCKGCPVQVFSCGIMRHEWIGEF